MIRLIAPVLTASLLGASPAAAERLVVSLSNQRVPVTSNFVGENLVLFGTIEPDPGRTLRSNYDLVVTVSGPPESLRTRRKKRVLGIWVNVDNREFLNVPSYLAVLSSRPIDAIATPEVLRRQQVGLLNTILTQRVGADFADTVPNDPFRAAFVRLKEQQQLYSQSADGVTFLTPTVFRATIPIPSNARTGHYSVDTKLFAGGQLLTRAQSDLRVIKTGAEQYIAEAATEQPVLYGLATMSMALAIGWFASVVFRRD
jgi:uncharacterized protein (TIGR02186 family)